MFFFLRLFIPARFRRLFAALYAAFVSRPRKERARFDRQVQLQFARGLAAELRRAIRADCPVATRALRRSCQVLSGGGRNVMRLTFRSRRPYAWAVNDTRYPQFITHNLESFASARASRDVYIEVFRQGLILRFRRGFSNKARKR